MTTKLSSKAIALGAISVLIACILAIVNTVAQGYLYEMKKAIADLDTAKALNLDAINKLKGTENAAHAAIIAAQYESTAIRDAARQNATATETAAKTTSDAIIAAAKETVLAETSTFQQLTEPLITGPAKRMTELNNEIGTLRHELQSGYYAGTPLLLMPADRTQKAGLLRVREEQLEILQETNQKNWGDAKGMVMGIIGNQGGLYPNGKEPPPEFRIIQER